MLVLGRVQSITETQAESFGCSHEIREGVAALIRRIGMKNQDELAREGVVTVRGLASGFAQTVETRTHRLVADEPLSSGGTDRGPTPYDLLLAALGS